MLACGCAWPRSRFAPLTVVAASLLGRCRLRRNAGLCLTRGMRVGVWTEGTPHLRVLTNLSHSHGFLTPRALGCRSVDALVVPARPVPHIPDAPDAVAGSTASGTNGAGPPAAGPPTRCPTLAAARCPAPAP